MSADARTRTRTRYAACKELSGSFAARRVVKKAELALVSGQSDVEAELAVIRTGHHVLLAIVAISLLLIGTARGADAIKKNV